MTEPLLICTRLKDMWKVHPDQVASRCSKCGETVGVYPSGQSALKQHPKMAIVCAVCAAKDIRPGDEAEPAGSWDEVAQEMRDSVRRQ